MNPDRQRALRRRLCWLVALFWFVVVAVPVGDATTSHATGDLTASAVLGQPAHAAVSTSPAVLAVAAEVRPAPRSFHELAALDPADRVAGRVAAGAPTMAADCSRSASPPTHRCSGRSPPLTAV